MPKELGFTLLTLRAPDGSHYIGVLLLDTKALPKELGYKYKYWMTISSKKEDILLRPEDNHRVGQAGEFFDDLITPSKDEDAEVTFFMLSRRSHGGSAKS